MVNKSGNDEELRELALFAGAGGGILGGKLLGWRTVCAVEWEQYPASVLCARQNEGLLPHFPIWDDVQTFDGKPWRGIVDVISGGFPCQDISCAGKGAGIEGQKSGMWKEFARIISEVRPQYVFVENSPMLTSRGLGTVLGDLASMGFDAEWGVLSAADVGANHKRDRIWIIAGQRDFLPHAEHDRLGWGEQQSQSIGKENGDVADSTNARQLRAQLVESNSRSERRRQSQTYFDKKSEIHGKKMAQPISDRHTNSINDQKEQKISRGRGTDSDASGICGELAHSNSAQCERNQRSIRGEQKHSDFGGSSWWATEPNVGRVANGVAARVDRLKAIGNGQVPLCAATAFKLLKERLK